MQRKYCCYFCNEQTQINIKHISLHIFDHGNVEINAGRAACSVWGSGAGRWGTWQAEQQLGTMECRGLWEKKNGTACTKRVGQNKTAWKGWKTTVIRWKAEVREEDLEPVEQGRLKLLEQSLEIIYNNFLREIGPKLVSVPRTERKWWCGGRKVKPGEEQVEEAA